MAIRFLSTIEEWKDFSNLSKHPIELDGETWKSVEHYYQYRKYEKTDLEFALRIRQLDSPKEVKKLTLENPNYLENWDEIKLETIKKAVYKKFETYPALKNKLLSTGKQELIEANPEDYFWGEGEERTGKNMRGKILMEIRDSYKEKK